MSNVRIGSRLGIGFGLIGLLMSVAIGFGLWGQQVQRTAAADLDGRIALQENALMAKFWSADFAGWQTGYAFDITRGVPNATSDDSGQRKEFLASTRSFTAVLDKIGAQADTAAERQAVTDLRAAFDAFMAIDQRIIAGYRAGDQDSADQASTLATGPSLDAYGKIAAGADKLATDVGAETDRARADAIGTENAIQTGMLILGVLCLTLAAALAVLVTRSIVAPLRRTVDALAQVSDRDLTARLPADARDELGDVARALNATLDVLRDSFASIGGNSTTLATASRELTAVAARIGVAAGETAGQSDAAAGAAGTVSHSVQTVAAATEQMNASIREISGSASEAARMAQSGVDTASQASGTVAQLGESSTEIGNVIGLITSIAEQTNLLALNATIEAARAGESGKGFAVVAGEVKDLAQATAKATDDISQRIQKIQQDTSAAIHAIGQIGEIIGRISEHSTTIAAAVEEQTATTVEMSRNISAAANGSSEIAANIDRVATAAQNTAGGVAEQQRTADDLALVSADLNRVVAQFRV